MLDVRNISFKYGEKDTLKDISFNLKEGEILGFLGPNGCGKTTTFRLICGLLKPYKGIIYLNGKKTGSDTSEKISYLIEERAMFPKYKVLEMLLYFGKIKGIKKEILYDKINYYLNLFNMEKYKNSKIETLSKGNQQKIQFISCLLNDPKLLVLDEPISGLDLVNAKEIMDIIIELKKNNTMIIFSSHQINMVEKYCDKVVLINNGEVILNGELSKIKSDYKKQDIKIKADNIDIEKIKATPGVIDLYKTGDILNVKIENKDIANDVFKILKNSSNMSLFSVFDAGLEEIFVEKVKEAKK